MAAGLRPCPICARSLWGPAEMLQTALLCLETHQPAFSGSVAEMSRETCVRTEDTGVRQTLDRRLAPTVIARLGEPVSDGGRGGVPAAFE
jgi:hypothetical protein